MKKMFLYEKLMFVASFITLWGCKKINPTIIQSDTEVQTAIDYTLCETEFMQVGSTLTNLTIKTKSSPQKLMNGYANISAVCDTLTWISGDTIWTSSTHQDPIYEYDFGACSSYMFDGIQRTGKWRITYRKGGIKKAGSSILVKFINYKANGMTYSVDSIVFNTGGLNNGIYTYTMNVYNAFCKTNTWTISYNSTQTIQVDTKNTADPSDDITIINGNTNGKNRENRGFSAIVNNLIKYTNCKYITKGTVQISPSELNTRTLDYGDGTCDDKAIMTINNNNYTIILN